MSLENELAYERDIHELREENARLKQQVRLLTVRRDQLTRERDEARAAIVAALDEFTATKVLKLRIEELKAEVARLEGLILDWELYEPGSGCHANLLAEARRIRAGREEGR